MAKGRYIRQIYLQGRKEFFPNKYFSPFEFMDKFNEVLLGRYDMKVIEVKYIVSSPPPIQSRAST